MHACGYLRAMNPHTHISGTMLYQVSYQAPGSKVVERKGIQLYSRIEHASVGDNLC